MSEELLRSLQPVLRFDSHEAFFADDVRAMSDSESFRLVRADTKAADYVVASHASGPLDLAFLALDAEGRYPNGHEFVAGDHLGLDLTDEDYATRAGDYRELARRTPAALRDRVYGRWVDTADGTWLQYWYFYLYNDAQFAGRVDLHEGDWEMVQVFARGGAAQHAVFAQHAYAERRDWDRVERDADHGAPIVYPGRGSHASYFERGLHRTHVHVGDEFLPLWWDVADGAGPSIRQELEIVGPETPWVAWAGRWGGTRPRLPLIDGESPGGPATHGQWRDPSALERIARGHEHRPLETAPPIHVKRSPPGMRLRFDFRRQADRPDRLLLTATTDGQPPVTETLVVAPLTRGDVHTRSPLDPDRPYAVDISTVSVSGIATSPDPETTIELRALRAISPVGPLAALLVIVDRLSLAVAARRARRVKRRHRSHRDGRPA